MKRFIVAAALATATMTAPAFAASSDFKMELAYSNQNLATRSGAEAEYDYIRKQVAERCAAENSDARFGRSYAQAFCIRTTMKQAVKSIDSDMLNQIHAERR